MTCTPGPWSLGTSFNDKEFDIIGPNGIVGFLLHANDADSRLIAAAPDLLAALKKLHDYAHAFVGDMHRQDIEAFKSASAAITKAEGTFS